MILSGGTGGHVFPALAVAECLRDRGNQVTWMGTRKGLESKVVPAAGFEIDWLSVSGFRGKNLVGRLLAPLRLVLSCCQSGWILFRRKPDIVLGMGGFVSGPGGLIAYLARIPLVVHEQNAIPGTTNRWLAKIANQVLEAFPGSFDPSVGAICTGNPLREQIADLVNDTKLVKGDQVNILVVGGSQGAQILNEMVPEAVGTLQRRVNVWHQTGEKMQNQVTRVYEKLGLDARVDAFVKDMAFAYKWADMVICRAGAMTVSELAAAGLPGILIPFPYAIDDHQTHNAKFVTNGDAGVLIPQSELNPKSLAEVLCTWSADVNKILTMGVKAKQLAKPHATATVCDYCLRVAT